MFHHFVPNFYVMLVCFSGARNKCNRKLLLLWLNAPKNVFKLDGWWHFSFFDHKNRGDAKHENAKNEMDFLFRLDTITHCRRCRRYRSVCVFRMSISYARASACTGRHTCMIWCWQRKTKIAKITKGVERRKKTAYKLCACVVCRFCDCNNVTKPKGKWKFV